MANRISTSGRTESNDDSPKKDHTPAPGPPTGFHDNLHLTMESRSKRAEASRHSSLQELCGSHQRSCVSEHSRADQDNSGRRIRLRQQSVRPGEAVLLHLLDFAKVTMEDLEESTLKQRISNPSTPVFLPSLAQVLLTADC